MITSTILSQNQTLIYISILLNHMHAMMSYYTNSISPTAVSDKKLTCSLTSSRVSSSSSKVVVCCAGSSNSKKLVSGVVFEPFKEVNKELKLVTNDVGEKSLARHVFAHESEASINVQINVEYNISYVYHAMYAYFDRDNVGLKGFAKFFKESSKEKRRHAETFMEYQNKRGGKVKLHSILMPVSEFHNQEKGDASHAMELALSLEKLTNEKLLHVHKVGNRNNDVHLAHFVKTEFLGEQLESIKKISEYVAQLRRVGKGHGVWHFNQMLLKEGGAAFLGDVTSQMFLEVF